MQWAGWAHNSNDHENAEFFGDVRAQFIPGSVFVQYTYDQEFKTDVV